jgi:hypothetical protein
VDPPPPQPVKAAAAQMATNVAAIRDLVTIDWAVVAIHDAYEQKVTPTFPDIMARIYVERR